MTHEEFIAIVRKPELVSTEHISDFKELMDLYPYFAATRLFYVKALKDSKSIQFAGNLKIASLYCSSRRWLYYYLNPERVVSPVAFRRARMTKSGGDYFDLMNIVESDGGDTKQSLKNLAERLKLARTIVTSSPEIVMENNDINLKELNIVPEEEKQMVGMDAVSEIISENKAKELIVSKKYAEAIEILKVLNLNNPKKSVYFADQIRFLEKIIANSKK
jgi:hypothetical protein